VAGVARWLRGRGWTDVVRGPASFAAIGAIAGVVALALAYAVTPVVEVAAARDIDWSQFPLVRGSPSAVLTIGTLVAMMALATELALRGWIVERALELGVPAA